MDRIEIKVPSSPKYLQMLRLSTSSIANRIGFDIDDVEDLKVMISEMVTFLLPINNDIRVSYEIEEDKLAILISVEDVNYIDKLNVEELKLKKQILMSLADEFETTEKYIKIVKHLIG